MKLSIKHQDSYSRGELLLRTFFGFIYIAIPHIFVMLFVAIWANILSMIAWWAILFTGKYPKSWFEFQVKLLSWNFRLSASMANLIDGYPAIGVNGTSDKVTLDVPYPASLSRGLLLLKTFFGVIYCSLPHQICLMFRGIGVNFLMMLAWWVILFTGKFPASWHEFIVGQYRWSARVGLYMGNMTDEYPPFTGKE